MALKPDREVLAWDISRFFVSLANTNGTTAERGGIAIATGTVGSGAAMDQTANACYYGTGANTAPAVGMLMADVVNVDLVRQILNPNKSEHQLNDKVPLMRKGWAVTNMIDPVITGAITAEANAYAIESGRISTNNTGPLIGKFMSSVDEDGYAKVWIDL